MKNKVVHYSTSDFDDSGKWLFTTLCSLGDLEKRDNLTFESTKDRNKITCNNTFAKSVCRKIRASDDEILEAAKTAPHWFANTVVKLQTQDS